MIRIIAILIPQGDEAKARRLGVLEIANDGTGNPTIGHYNGKLVAEYTGPGGRVGTVQGFNRKRQSVWSLVGAFLKLFGHTKHSPKMMGLPAGEACEDAPQLQPGLWVKSTDLELAAAEAARVIIGGFANPPMTNKGPNGQAKQRPSSCASSCQ